MEITPDKIFTEVIDGQEVVRTVEVTGDIVPEEKKDPKKYVTALVRTSDGLQQALKTYSVGGGGGGGITVDDAMSDTSTNPVQNKVITAALGDKQDALVSGTNIKTVNSNSLLGSGNIDIDALPDQTGQSGKFLTTDGTDASWGEVSAPEGVYTEDNLVGGTNISLDNSYSGGGIDPDTLACFHFDDSVVNASSYATEDTYQGEGGSVDLRTDSTVAYINGKFDKAISVSSANSDNHFILNPNYLSYYDEITFEYWLKYKSLQINATQVGLYGQSGQYSGGWNFMSLYPGGATSYLWVSTVGGLNSNRQLTNEEQSYVNNDWNHLALCCKKGVFTKFYINGHLIINDTTHTSLSNYQFDPAEAKLNVLFFDPNCGIDEIRLSKTLRYTGDTFEVPNAPFNTSYTTIKKINNTMSAPSVMTGATSSAAGTSGLVPAPASADRTKFLKGDATWATINALQNNSTGSSSLSILGTATTSTESVSIGNYASATVDSSVAIGPQSVADTGNQSVAIGSYAKAHSSWSIAIGRSPVVRTSSNRGIAIGANAIARNEDAIAIGGGLYDYQAAIAYGTGSIAIGHKSGNSYNATQAANNAIAIGSGSYTLANYAIQIGPGTNSTANTFSVGLDSSHNYQMLDSTGTIPLARLPIVQITQADYDALVQAGTVDANKLYFIVAGN